MNASDADRPATLTPEALADEIESDRRSERHLVTIGLVAAAVTLVVLALRGLW